MIFSHPKDVDGGTERPSSRIWPVGHIALWWWQEKKYEGKAKGKEKFFELNVISMTPFHEGDYSNYHTATSL